MAEIVNLWYFDNVNCLITKYKKLIYILTEYKSHVNLFWLAVIAFTSSGFAYTLLTLIFTANTPLIKSKNNKQ